MRISIKSICRIKGWQKTYAEMRNIMRKISIMVPCYNEEENVVPLSER